MVPSDTIEASDMPDNLTENSAPASSLILREAKNEFERRFILQALRLNNWNITETAQQLGIERTNLHRKMRQHNISREQGKGVSE